MLWAVFSLLLKTSRDGDTETSLGTSLVPQRYPWDLLLSHCLPTASTYPPSAFQVCGHILLEPTSPTLIFFSSVFEPQMNRGSQALQHLLCGLPCISLSPGTTSHLSHPASSGAQIPPFIVLRPSRSLLSTLPEDTLLKT